MGDDDRLRSAPLGSCQLPGNGAGTGPTGYERAADGRRHMQATGIPAALME